MLKVAGIQMVLKAVCCRECRSGLVTFDEGLNKRVGHVLTLSCVTVVRLELIFLLPRLALDC